jgi:hypothetical protein
MHYAWASHKSKGNSVYVYRSDDAWSWGTAELAWDVPYSQHAAIPFIPAGSSDLYAFGTEPRHDVFDGEENAAIGFRVSRDSGRTWSDVQLIAPVNDPGFQGMSAMRMAETDDGAWLIGSHAGTWYGSGESRSVSTRQYLLRSEDRGATWHVQPAARPDGWFVQGFDRMDEGRPINLGGGEILFLVRTPTGFLWELRSFDNGRTWSEPAPTTLAHPDAPPMIAALDAETLVVFHHNRAVPGKFSHTNRVELWVSLSRDKGHTWGEPRFVIANACEAPRLSGWGGSTPMVSYADILVEDGTVHLFLDHQMRQVLQARFALRDIESLPTRADFI